MKVLELANKKGVICAKDLAAEKLPREYLSRLAQQGTLERVGHGLYRATDREVGEHQILLEASQRVPQGVITLLSALRFHGLTTQNPFEVWMAVHNKSWIPKVTYPPVRFVYFSEITLAEGVDEHLVDDVNINVFNPAKTVADCFKYRNKIGLDVALEAFREGWRNQLFTMDALYHYAKICRVHNVMRPYLETLH